MDHNATYNIGLGYFMGGSYVQNVRVYCNKRSRIEQLANLLKNNKVN